MRQVHDSMTAESSSLRCPFCEVYEHTGHGSQRCPSCSGFFSETLLKALRQVTGLPKIVGRQPARPVPRLPD